MFDENQQNRDILGPTNDGSEYLEGVIMVVKSLPFYTLYNSNQCIDSTTLHSMPRIHCYTAGNAADQCRSLFFLLNNEIVLEKRELKYIQTQEPDNKSSNFELLLLR